MSCKYDSVKSIIYDAVCLLFMCGRIDLKYGCETDGARSFFFLFVRSIEDSQASDKVLLAVEKALRESPFFYQGARILSGQEEGAFGWVTVNYLDDRLTQVSAACNTVLKYLEVFWQPFIPLHCFKG